MSPNSPINIPKPARLATLPDELLLQILSYLDIPDLLTLSRTAHHLRALCLDPILHLSRLRHASLSLSHSLPARPPLSALLRQHIYITRTTLAARALGRSLVSIKLNRKLGRRPSAETLVELGVLPRECYGKGRGVGGGLAPGLVETKRRIERERVKDLLRGWVEEWRRRGEEMRVGEGGNMHMSVGRLVRRFGRDEKRGGDVGAKGERWGRGVEGRKGREEPARAQVLGLRRFWEEVGKEGGLA